MNKLFILLLSSVISSSCYSMSFNQAREIYMRITQSNHMLIFPKLVKVTDSDINAEAALVTIILNTGMLNGVRNEHEMAMVLGHELAHGRLGHMTSTIKNEYAADKLGAYYAKKAGYNICIGSQLIKRFGKSRSKTHPSGYERAHKLGC